MLLTASRAALPAAIDALETAERRGVEAGSELASLHARLDMAEKYVAAYRRYSWPVRSIVDFRLAPFHLLATGSTTHLEHDHVWHMQELARLAAADPDLLLATSFLDVALNEPDSEARATTWWNDLTARGGEGMVVKPHAFISRGKRGLVQPAVKCRGQEYLRIIYGAEYTTPANLERLHERGLGKKTLARPERIRARRRGPRAIRPRRATLPSTRMRLRRPRDGKRTRRPATVTLP